MTPTECKPTGNPEKRGRSGIGMPATLYLQQFADILYAAFGEYPYLVGSALTGTTWRDVDIRIMLESVDYANMGFGDPEHPHENTRWCAFVMAFSALGQQMTGLPIDFQIQEVKLANKEHDKARSALILGARQRQLERKATTESAAG